MHLLQFVNYYASIIYAAFFNGMSVVSPGGHDQLSGFHHEEVYEAGSDTLIEAMKYAIRVEPVRTLLTSKLKVERRLIGECLQGDLLHKCKQSTEKSLTPAPLNKLLRHKKPLVKHTAYATHKTWMGQSYHKQFLSPPTHVRKHINESTTIKVLLSREGKEKCSSCNVLNFGKFVLESSGKLIMLVLIIQVAAVQAFHNTTHVDLVSAGNATDSFSMIPTPAANQASFNMMPKNTSDLAEIHQYVDIRNEVLQKILHQTDTIINDLQEIAIFLIINMDTNRHPEERSNTTTLPRVVRSLPIEESIMCEIEQDTLINLRNELQATLEQPIGGGSNNCQLNFDSDSCEELIKLVQCGYSHLRDGFIAARENMNEVVLMGYKFAEFKEKYMRLLDDTNKFHSQEYNQKINKLKTEVQELQNLLNTSFSLLKEQRIKSCISEISSGKIESAIEDFKSLNDDAVLPKIIRSVYSEYGNLSQIENIVNFMKKFPSCAENNITYPVLFREMHKKDHSSSPYVLIVAHAAESCMGGTFIKPHVRGVIVPWAHIIHINNDYALIKYFARKHSKTFQAYLPDLIDQVYVNNLTNVENIIMFVHNLPYIEDASVGYSSLFNKMRSNGHVDSYQTLILASRVKEYMEMSTYPNIEQYYKDMFNTLKSNLPNSVKGLIWSNRNSCTIFNVYYGEYLYAANYFFNYEAFTWASDDVGQSSLWKLDMLEKGKYFKIINTYYERFLFSSEMKYGSHRRQLRTETGGDGLAFYWRLEPQGDNFLIRSIGHESYLYSSNYPNAIPRRYVYGRPQDSVSVSATITLLWRIAC